MNAFTRAWVAAGLVMLGAAGFACAAMLGDVASGVALIGVALLNGAATTLLLGGPLALAVWLIIRHAAARSIGATLRSAWTGSGMLGAVMVGLGLAAATFITSRASLAGDRAGSLFFVVFVVTPVVLMAVACGLGFARASFWAAVGAGLLAMLGALVGTLAIAIPEGAVWPRPPASSSSTATRQWEA
jgi:hypothetical protein